MRPRTLKESFCNAGSGLWFCLKTQKNMRIHLAAAFLVFVLAWVLRLGRVELAILFLAVSLVFTAEIFNTAVEKAIDLVVSDYHPLARVAKDVAAGAVLVAALNAVAVGALIFLPHLVLFFSWRF
jgi:diacylglycerol kinase (ATP)